MRPRHFVDDLALVLLIILGLWAFLSFMVPH